MSEYIMCEKISVTNMKVKPGVTLPEKVKREDGFLTTEAAMLMPVILTVILLTVYLSAHVHGRTCLYESAAEQAVSGHEQEVRGLFAVTAPVRRVTESKKKRTVEYTAKSAYLGQLSFLSIEEKAEYRIDEPVKAVRKAFAARGLSENVVK